MAKKVELKMLIDNQLESVNPKTTADNVFLTDGTTVQSAISTLQSKVATIEGKLYLDTVYMTDSNGNILNDGSGTNLVAVY